ncbi:3,4-dihydroxy-2-butanone 4-phosphate synthase [anaerobic digester metagenome]
MALLRAADRLLDERRGQTELSIALAGMADITPAVTICEMLDDETGFALSKEGAMEYARKHGLVFVEGQDVLDRWETQKQGR